MKVSIIVCNQIEPAPNHLFKRNQKPHPLFLRYTPITHLCCWNRGSSRESRAENWPIKLNSHHRMEFFSQIVNPFLVQCSISTPPENVRKQKVFWHRQGAYKWNIGLNWVYVFQKRENILNRKLSFWWCQSEERKNIRNN